MSCPSCKAVVQLNATGVCLGCQRGFPGVSQEDSWKPVRGIEDLQHRQKEIEDAIEKGV